MFSLILTVAATMTNTVLFVVLIGIDFAIFFLVGQLLGGWPTEPVGVSLLAVSASSFYGAGAVLINRMAGKTVVPVGKRLLEAGGVGVRVGSPTP